jgi:hypothetical protein
MLNADVYLILDDPKLSKYPNEKGILLHLCPCPTLLIVNISFPERKVPNRDMNSRAPVGLGMIERLESPQRTMTMTTLLPTRQID